MLQFIKKVFRTVLAIATGFYTLIIFMGADSIMDNEGPLTFLAMMAIMFGAWWLTALMFKD